MVISDELYQKLKYLGLVDADTRIKNEGTSNYSQHIIQPWSVWLDYPELTSFDKDIIKRVLRTKDENCSPIETRIRDYKKIKHICDERIRQLQFYKTCKLPLSFNTEDDRLLEDEGVWNAIP